MNSFQEFREDKDNSKIDSLMDMVKAIQKVFKSQTLDTRRNVWKKLTSKKGEAKIKELIITPNQSISYFRNLI